MPDTACNPDTSTSNFTRQNFYTETPQWNNGKITLISCTCVTVKLHVHKHRTGFLVLVVSIEILTSKGTNCVNNFTCKYLHSVYV